MWVCRGENRRTEIRGVRGNTGHAVRLVSTRRDALFVTVNFSGLLMARSRWLLSPPAPRRQPAVRQPPAPPPCTEFSTTPCRRPRNADLPVPVSRQSLLAYGRATGRAFLPNLRGRTNTS